NELQEEKAHFAQGDNSTTVATSTNTIYVDCSVSEPGHGLDPSRPLSTLESLASFDLKGIHSILFKRGTSCRGEIRLKKSDAPLESLTFGSYGPPPLPRAEIKGSVQYQLKWEKVADAEWGGKPVTHLTNNPVYRAKLTETFKHLH